MFRDVHTGAELWERPQLSILRDAVRRGDVDAAIIHALDRLSRKQAHVAIVADRCDRAGVPLLFVTEEFERSAVGEFIRSAKAFAAEREREKIRERMQRGMHARIASGKLASKTTPPYGYRWRDQHKTALDIDTTTGPVLQRIFMEAARGESLRKIAQRLNDEHVPAPGGGAYWHFPSIRQMLAREEYTGVALALKERNTKIDGKRVRVARPDAERVILPEGTIPALVDRQTFAAVQERLTQNKEQAVRNHRHPERFLLRAGHVCCGYCGKSIGAYCGNAYQQKGRTYHVPDRYRANRHNTDCPLVWHNAAELDAAIWAKVYAILTTPAIIREEVAKRRKTDPTATNRRALDRALSEVERKRTNLVRTMAGIDDADSRNLFLGELNGLSTQKRTLTADLDTLMARYEAWQHEQQNLDNLEAWCLKVGRGLENASYERKRKALMALGVKVRLYAADRKPRLEFETCIGAEETNADDHAIVSHRSRAAR